MPLKNIINHYTLPSFMIMRNSFIIKLGNKIVFIHPSYVTSDLSLDPCGFSAASSCCWSDELYVGYTLNCKKLVYPTYCRPVE